MARIPDGRLQGAVALGLVAAATLVAAGCASRPSCDLGRKDLAEIRGIAYEYVAAWLANDRNAVMATLTEDPVLIPSGTEPIAGRSAVEAFWWPASGPRTTVNSYTSTIDEIDGSGSMAYVRGHADLEFTLQRDGGAAERQRTRSVFLMIVRRGRDGDWRIARRIWTTL